MIHIFDFKEKSYFRAFFLPSLVSAMSATIAIEYSYFRKLDEDKKKDHSLLWYLKEAIITFCTAFIMSFIAFYLVHLTTGFGNSMLHTHVSDFRDNV